MRGRAGPRACREPAVGGGGPQQGDHLRDRVPAVAAAARGADDPHLGQRHQRRPGRPRGDPDALRGGLGVENRHRRQRRQHRGGCTVTAEHSHGLPPVGYRLSPARHRRGLALGLHAGIGELRQPPPQAAAAGRRVGGIADDTAGVERVVVAALVTTERRADRHRPVSQSRRVQHRLDQGASCPAVAVAERMDRLELAVSDHRPQHRRMAAGVQVAHQVLHQRRHTVLGRRHEHGFVDQAARRADPDRLITQHAPQRAVAGACEQQAVDAAEVVEGGAVAGTHPLPELDRGRYLL